MSRKTVWFSCTRIGFNRCWTFGIVLARWSLGFVFAKWFVFLGPHHRPNETPINAERGPES